MGEITESKVTDTDAADLEGQSKRVLNILGLTIDDLKGKKVLDIGAGERHLQRFSEKNNINTQIVSVDNDVSGLKAGEKPYINVALADVDKAFPFAENTFDLLINVGGSFKRGAI